MELLLKRNQFHPTSTIGDLFVDGTFECFILEDVVREPGVKVYGKTAIPAGKYEIVLIHSPKFKRVLPMLKDVPMFTGILIHPGNKPEDTEGCLLPGRKIASPTFLSESKLAFNALYPKIEKAIKAGEKVFITIQNERKAA